MSPDEIFELLTKAKAEAGVDHRVVALQMAALNNAALMMKPVGYNVGITFNPNSSTTINVTPSMSYGAGDDGVVRTAKTFLDFLEGP